VEPLMNIKDYIREQSMYMRDFNGEDLEWNRLVSIKLYLYLLVSDFI
jgi:hypothetical protein